MKDIEALHRAEFEGAPEVIAAAPGVVKLLGEQSESVEGLVLAAALSFELRVALSLRRDSSLRFFACDLGERKRTSLGNLKFKREDRWANYPKAAIDLLQREGFPLKGLNVTVAGDIPVGLGLASSSAFVLATALALKELFGLPHRSEELAELARRAEAEFFGKSSGLHDYLTSALATPGSISIVDLRSSRRRALPFFDGDWALVLTDSKVPRLSVEAELRQREEDARRALALLETGKRKSLRDFSPEEIDELMGRLPESVRRRALHLAEEHLRVLEAEDCLARGEASGFGRIVNKSHASLRNLYEVSCPEIDWLQKRAAEIEGVLCSRLTGKGFGGCTVSLMEKAAVGEYRKRLEDYERIFGFRPAVHEAEIAGGLRVLS